MGRKVGSNENKARSVPEHELLAACVDEVQSGHASWDECFARPEVQRSGIAPLLEIAAQFERFSPPEPSPACLVRIRERLAEKKRHRPALRWAWVVASLLALLLALGGGTAWAAGQSLPGQPLYPLKRWSEELRLRWTSEAQARSTLLMRFADRRLEETLHLCPQGDCPASLLADLEAQTEAAATEIERVPEPDRRVLLERFLELTARQQAVLERVLESAPEAARAGLQRALERSRRGHERARQALGKERPASPGHGKEEPPGQEERGTPTPHGQKTQPHGRKTWKH